MKNTTRLFVVAMILMAVIAMCVGCNVTGNTKETEAPTAEQTDVKATEAPTEEPTEEATTDDTEPAETVTEPAESETVDVTETQTEAATEPVEPATEVVQVNCTVWEVDSEPTCVGDGVRKRTVNYEIRIAGTNTVLGTENKLEYDTIPAAGHKTAERNAKAATCKMPGMTAETYCTVCNAVITPSEEIPVDPDNHGDIQILPAIEPGCITLGKTEGKYCAECGMDIVRQRDLPATGEHTLEIVPATHATCTRPGLSEGERCKFCGMWTVQQYETEAPTGHDWHWFVCNNCGEDQTSKGFEYQVLLTALPEGFSGYQGDYTFGIDCCRRVGSEYANTCCIITEIGTCTDRNIVFPEYIDGYKVVSILSGGGSSFNEAYNAGLIDGFYIPDTVIEDCGFFGRNKETKVKAPVYVASEATYQLYASGSNRSVLTLIDFDHFE